MQCPRCNLENADSTTYCERCGTLLRSLEYAMQSPTGPSETHQNITVFRVIRSILYFMAALITAFGLFATFTTLFGSGVRAEGLALFFGLGVLVGSVVIFLAFRHRSPKLHWVQFIWSILGVTAGMIMFLVLAFALAPNGKSSDLSFGYIILLYGFIVAVICLW